MKMYYFTDPMCSWCYGFSPVIRKLIASYPEMDLEIISGGFSPGSKQKITEEYKDFLEYHWRNVNLRSGQPFDHSMKFATETFVYDTEPSSRALMVIKRLLPDHDFEFLSLMQTSFYVEGKDITNESVLAELAHKIGIEKNVFLESFHSQEMKRKTIQGFQFSRQSGVQGFPSLVALENGQFKVISHGFQPFEDLAVIVDRLFRKITVSKIGKGESCTDDSCEN